MSHKMKDETIALVAVDLTIRSIGKAALDRRKGIEPERQSVGQIAEEAVAKVEEACQKGELGFLYRSFTVDPDRSLQ